MTGDDQDRINGESAASLARTRAGRTAGGRFGPGNPGRQAGSRNVTTLAVEALMEGEAEAITRKAIEAAKGGDMAAIRLVLDRIAPPRRERAPTGFSIPEVETLADLPKAAAALVRACADGLLSPGEAEQLARVLAAQRDALMASDLEARISALEGRRPRVEVV